MEACPDNSTSCLLRALLDDNTSSLILQTIQDANNQYNWDPVTFAFTVAIGVLAFIVACLTVFQGLLAAGPGRIKAGSIAIGPWAAKTTVHFNPYELALKTTAVTPFIDLKYVELRQDLKDGQLYNQAFEDEIQIPNSTVNRLLFGRTDQQRWNFENNHTATWVNLLGQVGLADVTLFPERKCQTDHLPGDLLAAPTFALMKTLVVLTVFLNDSSSVHIPDADSPRLSTVKGLTSDLTALDLSVMGPVVSFLSYGVPASFQLQPSGFNHETTLPTEKDIVLAVKFSEGDIMCGQIKIDIPGTSSSMTDVKHLRDRLRSDPNWSQFWYDKQCPLFAALCLGNMIFRPRLFPKKKKNFVEAVCLLARGSMWQSKKPKRFLRKFNELTENLSSRSTPNPTPEWVYPARKGQRPFIRLKLGKKELDDKVAWLGQYLGSTWLQPLENEFKGSRSHDITFPIESIGQSHFPWKAEDKIASIVYALTNTIMNEPELLDECGTESIIESLRYNPITVNRMQVMAQYEIFCIDEWLRHKDSRDVKCAFLVLLRLVEELETREAKKAEKKHDAKHDKSQGSSHHHHAQTEKHSAESISEAESPDNFEQAIQEAYLETDAVTPEKLSQTGRKFSPPSLQSGKKGGISTLSVPVKHAHDHNSATSDDDSGYDDQRHSSRNRYSKNESLTDREEMRILVEVLRYRALLFAAVLDMCTDSTFLMSPKFTDFVVRII